MRALSLLCRVSRARLMSSCRLVALSVALLGTLASAQAASATGSAGSVESRPPDQVWADALGLYDKLSGGAADTSAPTIDLRPPDPPVGAADRETALMELGGVPLLDLALSYRGVPYRWGGASRDGLDCSGLIVRAAADVGRLLPHSAARLHELAQPVPDGELRPGDLVFFANTYKPGISHVGIYRGGSQFLQASSATGQVSTGDLRSPYYRAKYAGAGRLALEDGASGTGISPPSVFGRTLEAPLRLGLPE